VDHLVDVDVELFDKAAGFGFELDFRDGLNRPGGHNGLGDVAARDFGQAGGRDFRIAVKGGEGCGTADDQDERTGKDCPNQPTAFPFALR
jgi:hypothetical protein